MRVRLGRHFSAGMGMREMGLQEAEERECEKLEIDSLAFVGPRALWAAFTLFEDGDREAVGTVIPQ